MVLFTKNYETNLKTGQFTIKHPHRIRCLLCLKNYKYILKTLQGHMERLASMNKFWTTWIVATVAASALSIVATQSHFENREIGSRYEFFAEPLNWTAAHKNCKYYEGQLVLPMTPEEAQKLIDFMASNETTAIHVGFNDVFEEGKYLANWGRSISEIGYQQFVPDQEEGPDSNCGSFVTEPAVGLRSIPCTDELPYFCQYPLWRDDENYRIAFGFGWFKLHNDPVDWATAWETCREENAYLVVVRSKEEVDALQRLFGDSVDGPVHYGAHHKYNNHKFITIFDEPLEDSYSIWYPGFPGTFTNVESPVLNLVLSNAWTSSGLLLNEASYLLPFICKQDMHFNN